MNTGEKLAPGDAHPYLPPTSLKERIILFPELQSVSLIKFPKPHCFSHWFSLAHSPGQTSLPSSLSSAPCIVNICKSSLCFAWKTLPSWKTGSPAHRGKKCGEGDIIVPANRKMRKICCLRILSNNSHKICSDSNVTTSVKIMVGFQPSSFTNSICQLCKK